MKNSTIILSILFCFLISCQDRQAKTELEELKNQEKIEAQNIEVVKRVYEELNKNKNIQILDELYDPEYKGYSPSNRKYPSSLKQSKNYYSGAFVAFPDLNFVIKDIFAVGEYVIVRDVFTGTHEADYFGVKAKGNKVASGGIFIYRLKNGKIVEKRSEYDSMDFKDQLKNEIPAGWYKYGTVLDSYNFGIDEEISSEGSKSAFIVSVEEKIDGFSTLMQSSDATPFIGKKIKMTGYAKSEKIKDWAGFWLRIDGKKKDDGERPEMLGFDNMEDRPIKGNTDWTKYEIEMEVPDESVEIFYGSILVGKGKIWIDNISFEEVKNKDGKEANSLITELPINASFED